MKILEIKIQEDNLFNDLYLDLRKVDGTCLDTIILAGENGTGKTTLLELIYETYSLEYYYKKHERYDGIVTLTISLDDEETASINNILYEKRQFEVSNTMKISRNFKKFSDWDQFTLETLNDENEWTKIEPSWFIGEEIIGFFNVIYSTVDVNYIPRQIKSVTTLEVDENTKFENKSGGDLATEIQQLLVDIINSDALDLQAWFNSNPRKLPSSNDVNKRLNRFNNAFSKIFLNFKIKSVKNINDSKEILAEKNGKEIFISNLSSGEKQIIFRGAFLLRNLKRYENGIVLIDEPEISLHPEWQKNILEYYKSLFRNERGKMSSQVIISTHSPFIIHNHNIFEDKVLILKNNDGEIMLDENPEFPSIGTNELVNNAFNVTINNQKDPIIFVEGETDELYIKKYLQLTGKEQIVDVRWVGYYDEKGKAKFTGDTALNKLIDLFQANENIIENPIVVLYDSDTKKGEKDYSNFYIRTMPENLENKKFTKGIENLLSLPTDFDYEIFYDSSVTKDGYDGEIRIKKLNKIKLCSFICDSENFLEYTKNICSYIDEIIMLFNK